MHVDAIENSSNRRTPWGGERDLVSKQNGHLKRLSIVEGKESKSGGEGKESEIQAAGRRRKTLKREWRGWRGCFQSSDKKYSDAEGFSQDVRNQHASCRGPKNGMPRCNIKKWKQTQNGPCDGNRGAWQDRGREC